MSENNKGNRTMKYINIDNINPNILQMPDVDNYTNKKAKITGNAEPNATVYIEVSKKKTYTTKTNSKGAFSYRMDPPKAGTIIKVYVRDAKGRVSKKNNVTVKRKGPNYPTVKEVNSRSKNMKGKLNDSYSQVFAVIGSKVYVGKSSLGREAYISSEKYSKSKTIVKTKYKVSGGNFTMDIPVQKTGTKMKIYAVDYVGVVSLVNDVKVVAGAPEQPVVRKISDASPYILGYIPKAPKIKHQIKIKVGNKYYYGKSDKKGKFAVKVPNLEPSKTIKVYAIDVKKGKKRTSYAANVYVHSYLKFQKSDKNAKIKVEKITDSYIKGKVKKGKGYVYIKVQNKSYKVKLKSKGKFKLKFKKKLKNGTSVYFTIVDKKNNVSETVCKKVTK